MHAESQILREKRKMNTYETVMKLALERGFYFPSCEIYSDAHAGFWEYGPTGTNMKNNFIELWRRELLRRDDMIEIDGSQIMSRSVFVAKILHAHLNKFHNLESKNLFQVRVSLLFHTYSFYCFLLGSVIQHAFIVISKTKCEAE